MNERILCLDIGDVRIGVAVSDSLRMIASPVEVIHRVGFGPDVRRVKELCDQYETTLVLSGLPLNMDGTEGFQAQKVKLFCQQLEKAGLTVYYQDERLTTVTAENALLEDNMHRAQRKQNVDKVAAAVILQQWLDTAINAQQSNESEDNIMADNMNNIPEEEDNIIELLDENGETVRFEHLATLDYEDEAYIVLMIPEEDLEEDEEEGGVVIMKIMKDDEGNDYYEYVDDDDTAQAVFARFEQLVEEGDEVEDED